MKNCINCGLQLDDYQNFCPSCGSQQPAADAGANQYYAQPNPDQAYQAYGQQPAYNYDPTDHTAEFDAQDISENKCYAMLPYLLGVIGIVVALLASNDSPYLKFHIRQAIKITVVTVLYVISMFIPIVHIITAPLSPIVFIVVAVVKIICFFSICSGKAKEAPIVKSFGFLK